MHLRVTLTPPPVMVGLSPIYCWIIPTLTGLFRGFFTLTCVYEEMRWKYTISWLHKRRVRPHCIYDEIAGCRWGCGAWGGLFPSFLFEFFSSSCRNMRIYAPVSHFDPPSPGRVKRGWNIFYNRAKSSLFRCTLNDKICMKPLSTFHNISFHPFFVLVRNRSLEAEGRRPDLWTTKSEILYRFSNWRCRWKENISGS